MAKQRCICGHNGCRRIATSRHHVIYQQELRRQWTRIERERRDPQLVPEAVAERWPWLGITSLLAEPRNLVWLANEPCHADHHARRRPLRLCVLPDRVYGFAADLMGTDAAYEYLRRRYRGEDRRLDALLPDGGQHIGREGERSRRIRADRA